VDTLNDPYCERARAWASLQLDDDLGDIERILLEDHLTRCSRCATFVAGMRELTAIVRAAPSERPATPLRLPARPRRARAAVRVAAAAAVLAFAVGLGFLGNSLGGRAVTETSPQPEIALLLPTSVDREIKSLRTGELSPVTQPIGPPGRQHGTI
jgi:predicted anti-sigma-YlaC factor YlaD